jgi:hypothetical protein
VIAFVGRNAPFEATSAGLDHDETHAAATRERVRAAT